jgi:hypothetical protein
MLLKFGTINRPVAAIKDLHATPEIAYPRLDGQ